MLVLVYTFDHVFFLKVVGEGLGEHGVVDGDSCESDKNATHCFLNFHQVEPWMAFNLRHLEPLLRFCVQNRCYHLPTLSPDELWDMVVAIEDLLIEITCVWIFKWQVTANQCEKYNTTAPNINL